MGPVLFSILFGQVAVLDFTEKGEAAAWLPAHVSDVVALKLRFLGIDVRDRHFARDARGPAERAASPARGVGREGLARAGSGVLDALVFGRVRPAAADEESDRITVEVKVATGGRETRLTAAGRAGELDRLTADLAAQVAGLIGRAVNPETRTLLAHAAEHPFAVHRFLGMAERRLESGDYVQATLMFDRAGSFAHQGAIPEALEGRYRAESARVAKGDAEFGSRNDLAAAAAERASVALRDGAGDEARRALIDVLRYTSLRARRWTATLDLSGPDRAVIVGRDKRWLVQIDTGPQGLWTLHPPTGTVLSVSAGRKGLAGAIAAHLLLLNGRILSRAPLIGDTIWKIALPLQPADDPWERTLLAQGSLGVRADDGVVWVEVGVGALGQVATHTRPLAQSPGGILVRTAKGEIGLLRPGKKTPAWKIDAGVVDGAALTTDRALLLSGGQLQILQAANGKETRKLPAPKDGRILRAHGRYACLDATDGVHLFDVLAGEMTAVLRGPGPAIDCHPESEGVSILYQGGDLLFFHRDGKLLDRARAPGKPARLLRGSPLAPGPVAITDQGLFAFADPSPDPLLRDANAMIRLAELELHANDLPAALRLADWVALTSAGQVAQAETLRAAILDRMKAVKAATRAKARARVAEDASVPLPAFGL